MTHSSESLSSPEHVKLEMLQKDFCGIFDEGKKEASAELFRKISEEYQARDRKYHNFEHIEKMLSFLESYEQEIEDSVGVKLATYFHDIKYDTTVNDNEEQSAKYAKDCLAKLGISDDVVAHVSDLINATSKHEVIEHDTDSAIFLDGDLAILGSDEEEYNKYSAKIRQEYAWVPEAKYRSARRRVLEGFLNRARIYFTEQATEDLEQQARRNIERELLRLS